MGIDDAELASDLALVAVRFARHLRLRRRDTSALTLSQLSALTVLHQYGPMAPSAIAKAERIQPASVTRVLDLLEHAGFVTRGPHPTDHRCSVVTLTPAGVDAVTRNTYAREQWLHHQLAHLTPTQRTTLTDASHIITTILTSSSDDQS
ncbi:MAG: MarR family transcriptional regulator [Gordonia polyisoprenivorans]|nr:MarR family transcriptional regulator [Gordonia polyisoprenivorans]